MQSDTKLGHVTCAIHLIPCACIKFASRLDKPWVTGLPPQQQPRYQSVIYYKHWTVIYSFNNCNIIKLSHKFTTSEAFEEIHQVFLHGISENMASLVQSGKYGAMNTTCPKTIYYYVLKFVSEAYTLQ